MNNNNFKFTAAKLNCWTEYASDWVNDLYRNRKCFLGSAFCSLKGFSVISKAKEEDFRKSCSLRDFYASVNDCLNQLDDRLLPILQTYFEDDIFSVLERQAGRLGRSDYKILVAGKWHFALHVSEYMSYFFSNWVRPKNLFALGESSAGKSSLINLILGDELLSHHTLNTTATICEMKYGAERKLVLHYKHDAEQKTKPPARHIPLTDERFGISYKQQIKSYLDLERAEREKGSGYEKVEISWPHELLQVCTPLGYKIELRLRFMKIFRTLKLNKTRPIPVDSIIQLVGWNFVVLFFAPSE